MLFTKPPGDPAYDSSRAPLTRSRSGSGRKASSKRTASSDTFLDSARFSAPSFFSSHAEDRDCDIPPPIPAGAALVRANSDGALFVSSGSSVSQPSSPHEGHRKADHGSARSSFSRNKFDAFLRSMAPAAAVQEERDARSEYLARLDYLPIPRADSAAINGGGGNLEHRRLSSTSSASGVTDRRSSTSSFNGAAAAGTAVSGGQIVSVTTAAEFADDDQLYSYFNGIPTVRLAGTDENENEEMNACAAPAAEVPASSASHSHVSNNALSASLRKRWSFDNLLQLSDSGDFSASSLSQHPRVTTTLAAVPVSASSDMLDDYDGAAGAETSTAMERRNHSNSGSDGDGGGIDMDDLVDSGRANSEAPAVPERHNSGSEENKTSSAVPLRRKAPVSRNVAPATGSGRGVGSLDKSGTVHQQLTLRDSAGAMALRKASTVSPQATATHRKKLSDSGTSRFST